MNTKKIKFIVDEVLIKKPVISLTKKSIMFGCADHCKFCVSEDDCVRLFGTNVPHLDSDFEEFDYFKTHYPEYFI